MKTSSDYQAFILECDKEVQKGHGEQVKKKLLNLNISKIPYYYRRELSSICLRVGDYRRGLRILTPNVLDERSQVRQDVSDLDLAEYSYLLQRIGLYQEAHNHLARITSDSSPKLHLYRAFSCVGLHDYAGSIPHLKKYIDSGKIDPYQILRGKVNLLAAYVETKSLTEGEDLANELLAYCKANSHIRFQANVLELLSHIHVERGDLGKAKEALNASMACLKQDTSRYSIIVQKWQAYVQSLEDKSIEPLEKFKRKAIEINSYEAVRDADFMRIKVHFDHEIFYRLVFGTIYPAYRNRVIEEFNQHIDQVPETIIVGSDANYLDLYHGKMNDKQIVPPGKKIHQLLNVLFFDSYRPINIHILHSMVFPDEIININSSPNRIHQLVKRLRTHIESDNIPVEIKEERGCYIARTKAHFGVELRFDHLVPQTGVLLFKGLQDHSTDGLVSTTDLSDIGGLSSSAAHRYISEFIEKQWLQKVKSGKQTRYRILKAS